MQAFYPVLMNFCLHFCKENSNFITFQLNLYNLKIATRTQRLKVPN
jgi:hypothetical protein